MCAASSIQVGASQSVSLEISASAFFISNVATGWQYAISWLTVLPFEISAACNIIHYWPGSEGINNTAWIVPLLVALVMIQYFGVRGYGEVSGTKELKIG